MPAFEDDNHIRIGNSRIEIIGLPIEKTYIPRSWIKMLYKLDFSNIAGATYTAGNGISISPNNVITNTSPNVSDLPVITTGIAAPTTPKIGDVWNDTNPASATKPSILTKRWNGSVWFPTWGASNLVLSLSGQTLSAQLNGQSSNNVTLPTGIAKSFRLINLIQQSATAQTITTNTAYQTFYWTAATQVVSSGTNPDTILGTQNGTGSMVFTNAQVQPLNISFSANCNFTSSGFANNVEVCMLVNGVERKEYMDIQYFQASAVTDPFKINIEARNLTLAVGDTVEFKVKKLMANGTLTCKSARVQISN